MDFKIGQVVEGKVNGIQPYGVFVDLGQNKQGLIHISECKQGFVTNLEEAFTVGKRIKAVIIDIDEYSRQISLSVRVLQDANEVTRRKRKHYWTDYRVDLGFSTIAEEINPWVYQALKRFSK
ncbi:CvfD/Ygs/GSP13 family RNA-binding post-transcriptional regulator [Holzapfeliella sp. He02]|uniref:CvfD/Ygs/GSP13 family RNA-binding post-transcriptional regulator n=1 Tax=Holzapfeliella saturejae TaxID=3082953 RepID=A0ABU8SH23_9LACO